MAGKIAADLEARRRWEAEMIEHQNAENEEKVNKPEPAAPRTGATATAPAPAGKARQEAQGKVSRRTSVKGEPEGAARLDKRVFSGVVQQKFCAACALGVSLGSVRSLIHG